MSPCMQPHFLTLCMCISPHCTDLVEGGKGKTGNYYSEMKENEYEKMEDAEEYEVVDGEGETHANPNAQVDGENNDGYMDMSGNNAQPQPLLTNQQPSSDGQPCVEVNKGAVVDNSEDVEQEPVVKMSMTKNPAYDLPPSPTELDHLVREEGTQL